MLNSNTYFSLTLQKEESIMQIVMISAMFAKQVGMPETSLLLILGYML